MAIVQQKTGTLSGLQAEILSTDVCVIGRFTVRAEE